MKKIWAAFLGTMLIGGMLIASTSMVLAAQQGTCTVSDPEKVLWYENTTTDTSDGNDTLYQCGTGYANFASLDFTLAGQCKSANFHGDNWNDCISSVRPFIPSGRALCLYGNSNYDSNTGVSPVRFTHANSGIRYNLASGQGLNDGLTSWRFIDSAFGCGG